MISIYSKLVKSNSNLRLSVWLDKGYQGIQKLHVNSRTPQKKPRGRVLSSQEKSRNRDLAQLRVVGEHIDRCLKIFKILSERYRNRRRRFGGGASKRGGFGRVGNQPSP